MIVVAIAAGLIGYVIGKPASPQAQDKATDASEKPAEPQEPAFMKEGLVAYYPFNGNAKDESGNGNDGKMNNANPISDRFSADASAINFSTEKPANILLGSSSLFDPEEDFAVFSWIKREEDGHQSIFTKWGGDENNAFWFGTYDSELHFTVNNDGAGDEYYGARMSKGAEIPLSTWCHVGITRIKESLTYFVNGVAVDKEKADYIFSSGSSAVTVGTTASGSQSSGSIDDVRIYNRALTEEQAKALYDLEKPKE